MKYSGFSLIENEINECLGNNGKIEFLLGLDFRITDPKVLKILFGMARTGLNLKLFCFSDPWADDTPVYHPKIYLVSRGETAIISIGSSNLTAGGLKDNVEVNVVFEASIKEEMVSDIYGIYNRLKFQRGRFEPDLTYIEHYEEAYEIIQRKSIEALKEKSTKNRIRELKKREKVLPKPILTAEELFGWQRIVYERIPQGVFRTSGMYPYEEEFRAFYPENEHIRAKTRQILQQLRDLGLIEHISEDKWQRIEAE